MAYIEKQYAVDTGFRMLNTNLVNFEDTFFLKISFIMSLFRVAMRCLPEKPIREK